MGWKKTFCQQINLYSDEIRNIVLARRERSVFTMSVEMIETEVWGLIDRERERDIVKKTQHSS